MEISQLKLNTAVRIFLTWLPIANCMFMYLLNWWVTHAFATSSHNLLWGMSLLHSLLYIHANGTPSGLMLLCKDNQLIRQNINVHKNAFLDSNWGNIISIWGGKRSSCALVESSRARYENTTVLFILHLIDLSDWALVSLKVTCCWLHLCWCIWEILLENTKQIIFLP